MSERPFSYVEFAPGESVRDIALTYWGFSVRALPDPAFVHRVWPDGCISLTLVCIDAHGEVAARGAGAHLLGVRQTPFEVPLYEGVHYWGVRFRPEAGAWWLGVAAADLKGRNVPAQTIVGDAVLHLADAVAPLEREGDVAACLDAWIASRVVSTDGIDEVVRSAVAAIVATDGRRAIADIAHDVGVSTRVLQRRFAASVGLSPKAFAVLRRGRSAIKRVVTDGTGPDVGGWSGVALSSGFADQAHFTREVARLTRFAPNALRARLESIEHERLID